MKRIVFTGGGSAGHVTPNLAIIPHLQEKGWDISYIGSHQGIEKTIIECVEELDRNCAEYKKEFKKYSGKEAVQTIVKYIMEA